MKINIILYLVFLTVLGSVSVAERFQYIITERPEIYFNPKYFSFVNLTSRRHRRHDPFYYVDIHARSLVPVGNNLSVDFYFYEWLTNVYKRGFVEMHFKFCDMIHKDSFFGSSMRQGKLTKSCPYPPDVYHLYNMTIPIKNIPPHFPFKKGRIYCNATSTDMNELIFQGHIDMEIKEFSTRRKNNNTFISENNATS